MSVFIRCMYNEEVSENLLFCKALPLHTKGEDIFKCLDGFFNEHSIPWENCAGVCTDVAAANTGINSGVVKRVNNELSVPWENCAGVCKDGAATNTGINSGVVKRVKDKAPEVKWTHCFLHRQALASKKKCRRSCMIH